jgi:hypothetical protein
MEHMRGTEKSHWGHYGETLGRGIQKTEGVALREPKRGETQRTMWKDIGERRQREAPRTPKIMMSKH